MSFKDGKETFCTIARAKLIEFDEIIRDRATKLERARQAYLRAGMGEGTKRYIELRQDTRVKAAFEGLSRKIEKWAKEEPKENERSRHRILEYMKTLDSKEQVVGDKDTLVSTEQVVSDKETLLPTEDGVDGFDARAAACANDDLGGDVDGVMLFCNEESAKIRELEDQVADLQLQLQRALTSSTDTVMYDEGRLTEQNEKLKEENEKLTRDNKLWNIANMKLKKENMKLDKELRECKQSNACISAAVADEITKETEAAFARSQAEKAAQNEQDKIDLRRAKEIKRAEVAVERAKQTAKSVDDAASLHTQTQETIDANKKRAEEKLREAKKRLEQAKILGRKRKEPGLKLMSNLKL